ncbi:MAG: alanine--tRNA ligase [Omnitrophica bacterium]|nr:alanine--tRNA ligase [Candidatus Omnitrophota bacterium]
MLSSNDIRAKFLEFFKAKGHEVVPSASLVPKADPTLLFTSAGMNQFKDQFLGHNVTYARVCSSQKCLRTADLDRVGTTPSHHTFFEMLGNFSFGDYFKKEAILWAWEFLTETLGLKRAKLWVSVYKEDKESYGIWRDLVKVPAGKIKKIGAKENFWPSNAPKDGPNGPCGPCSEIFYDTGGGKSVEVWNLVFTQFERIDGGKLSPLPNKNIDTGMGLERITAIMQGVKTNFETDLFKPIIDEIKVYRPSLKAKDLNTIADHIRAVTFAISDNVAPSNEERGYVIRKLIRRAYLRGGGKEPFLYCIVPKVVGIMKDSYPGLLPKREEIVLIVKEEEERFGNTLSAALPLLEEGLRSAKSKVLKGDKIFKLADTYGLPLEVIEERAKKKKVRPDIAGYIKLMKEQRARSRKKSKLEKGVFCGLSEETPETAKNHTATHLLQAALRRVLGEHVHQAGSLVTPDRLRFDFTHVRKLTERELEKVELLVNECIKNSIPVTKEEKTLDEAKKEGAIALFDEKYQKMVTVVTAGDFSKEVCGGIHIDNTKDIEFFKIVRESSVASGVRRIEVVTAGRAREWMEESKKRKAKNEKLEKKKEEEKAFEKEKLKAAFGNLDLLIKKAEVKNGVKIIIEKVPGANMGILRNLADKIKAAEKNSFVMLAADDGGKVSLVLTLAKGLVSGGANASEEIKSLAKIIHGSGGGRADFAQAGGKDASKLEVALLAAKKMASHIIEGVSK